MAIWDTLRQDPMMGMLLMQSLQQLPQSLSKQNLPPRGAYAPGGYGGQQDGGMGDLVPTMLRMQQMRAAQENQMADNALQQRQFEAGQVALQQKASEEQQRIERIKRAIPGISAATGQPPEVVEAALMGGLDSNPLVEAMGKNAENYSLGNVRFSGSGNNPIARAMESVRLGAFDPVSGQTIVDRNIVAADKDIARSGRTSVNVDARNMTNGFDAMLGQAMEDRKAMTGKTDKLNELAAITGEMADIAASNPRVFEPASDFDALMTQGEAILKRAAANKSLSPEETQFLSAYNRAKQLNVTEGFNLVANLKPISEAEVKLGLQTALGPGKPVPQVMVRSVQAQLAAKRQADLQNEFDRSQAEMLQAAQAGGPPYSPAAHRLHMMEWEKANPVSQDSLQDVLATLSRKLPYGGGGKAAGRPDDDPLGLLAP